MIRVRLKLLSYIIYLKYNIGTFILLVYTQEYTTIAKLNMIVYLYGKTSPERCVKNI